MNGVYTRTQKTIYKLLENLEKAHVARKQLTENGGFTGGPKKKHWVFDMESGIIYEGVVTCMKALGMYPLKFYKEMKRGRFIRYYK